MDTLIKQYEIALKACKVMFPLGVAFFEILGLILWISLADTGYGLPIGLPIMLFGLLFGVIFFFAIKHMSKKLNTLQNNAKKGESR
jgi:ABC-type transport system involved in cytochrome bd biosynthesis fused ATPase/permease subunit